MGTTSEKLTYLNTTKTLIKEELNLGGANITNEPFRAYKGKLEGIYKDFLANGTDTLWNNWLPKVSGSGETITLNNTIEAKMDFVYKGNTYQYSTTGKNLFNSIYYKNKEIYTETISISTGNLYCTKLYLKPNTTYTISEALNNWRLDGGWIFVVADTNNQIIRFLQNRQQDYQTTPTTFTTNSEGYVYIGHRYGFTNGGADRAIAFLNTVNIQIEEGNTATSFEEYTGGPSPNPDYPQDIQVVSGDNTIKVEGKNIYTDEIEYNNSVLASNGTINSATGFIISKPISIDISKDIYVSFVAGSLTDKAIRVGYYDSNNNFISRPNFETTPTKLTPPSNAQYLRLSYDARNFSNVQVEYNQATTYEPYQSASYPISLGNIELCKIGDYQDKIYKDNGKWYLNKQIGKVVLDGSENWGLQSINSYGIANFNRTINDFIPISKTENYSKNDRFTPQNSLIPGTQTEGYLMNNVKQLYIRISSNRANTVETFKAWLSTHNTTVYYVLATPTTTEITDTTLISQLEAIKKSYNTQTNISQTNDDKPFILDVVALGELEI